MLLLKKKGADDAPSVREFYYFPDVMIGVGL